MSDLVYYDKKFVETLKKQTPYMPLEPLPPPAKVATPIPAPIGRKFREEEWA